MNCAKLMSAIKDVLHVHAIADFCVRQSCAPGTAIPPADWVAELERFDKDKLKVAARAILDELSEEKGVRDEPGPKVMEGELDRLRGRISQLENELASARSHDLEEMVKNDVLAIMERACTEMMRDELERELIPELCSRCADQKDSRWPIRLPGTMIASVEWLHHDMEECGAAVIWERRFERTQKKEDRTK